jgi:hypothetical protein
LEPKLESQKAFKNLGPRVYIKIRKLLSDPSKNCPMYKESGQCAFGKNMVSCISHFCKSISTGAQYVTPDSKIYSEKVKMSRFSSGNWFFFCTKLVVQLAVAGKRCNTVVHLQTRV